MTSTTSKDWGPVYSTRKLEVTARNGICQGTSAARKIIFLIRFVLGLLYPWNRWHWNLTGDGRPNIIALRGSPFNGADTVSGYPLNGAHAISRYSFGGAGGCPHYATSDTPKKTALRWRRCVGVTRRRCLRLNRCCFGDGRHRLLIYWLRFVVCDILRGEMIGFCLSNGGTHFVLDWGDQAREIEPVEGGVR